MNQSEEKQIKFIIKNQNKTLWTKLNKAHTKFIMNYAHVHKC